MDIPAVDHDGEPWFVMTDVSKALGYKNPAEMARPIDSMENTKKFLGKGTLATFISKAGLYQVLLRTQRTTPLARAFQDWMTKVVLPRIRKTGSYSMSDEPSPTFSVQNDRLFFLKCI